MLYIKRFHFTSVLTWTSGGEGGIRTHEALRPTAFRERHFRPLRHLSIEIIFGVHGTAVRRSRATSPSKNEQRTVNKKQNYRNQRNSK